MSSDPRRFMQDEDSLEKRFEELYRMLRPSSAPRPTDLPSLLVFAQEFWDKLNPAPGNK